MADSVPHAVNVSDNTSNPFSFQNNAPITIGNPGPETKRETVRNGLLAKIGPPSVEPTFVPGTCKWILEDDKFQSWHASCTQHLLWISGRPGKGKSHLAVFLGEYLSRKTAESSHPPLVLKFSCQNTDVRRSTSLAVYLNVLHQILQFRRFDEALHSRFSSILNDVHTTLNSNRPRDDLWDIIKDFINGNINTIDHPIYFILDGLDECDAESIVNLSEKLQHLCSTDCRQRRPHFKAILLSRPLGTISNRDLRIDLDDDKQYGEEILREIRLFVDAKMPNFEFGTRKHELERLKETLVERSNKTFLWVSLALKLLDFHHCDLKAILAGQGQDALDRLLPVGLPSIYNRMLLEALQGKCEGRANLDAKSCAKIIQLVCVAFRPLTLTELQGAVDVSLEASAITGYCKHMLVQSSHETVREHTEEQPEDADEEFEDTDEESDDESNGKTFQLVHLSLKEYLQQPRRFTFPAPLGLLFWPYLSSSVDTLRTAIHSFYYLDHILFVAIFLSLNGVFKSHPVAGFVLVALFARGLWNRWMQERSWTLQMILKVFEHLLDHCVFGIFATSERSCHRELFLRSLALLTDEKSGLQRETMENLEAKGALSAKKPKSVDAKLAPFGRYACRFWADHLYCLYEVDWTPEEETPHGKLVLEFLKSRLLDWLRSLSLHNNLRDGALSTRRLIRIFNGENRELEVFLKDAERFMMQFVPIIERAPFQVYGAALAFCPNNSIMRSTFGNRVLPFAKKIKSPHDDWSPILQVLEGHANNVTSVAFSNDGKLIASASGEDKVYLWDTETGRLKRVLRIENSYLHGTTFSPSSKLIACGWQDIRNRPSTIWTWNEQTGALVWSIEVDFALHAIACSLDGDVLAATGLESIQLWHLGTETILREIPIPEDTYGVGSVAFSPDGYLIASFSERILVWDIETGQQKLTIEPDDFLSNEHWHPGQEARLDSLAFSANDSATVSGSGHGLLQLWDPETGRPSKELLKHRWTDTAVAFSPDGTMVASGYDSSIRLWDSKSCSLPPEQLIQPKDPDAMSMVLSSDEKILAVLSRSNTMNIWNLKAGTLIPLNAPFPDIATFTISPRCDILAFTSLAKARRAVRLWSVTEGKEAHVLDQLDDQIIKLSFSSDGNTLAVLLDKCVHLLDPATGTTQHVLKSPTGNSLYLHSLNDVFRNSFSFCPKTRSTAYHTSQRKGQAIEIWDPASAGGSHVHLEGSTGHSGWTSFSPDGTKIAVFYSRDYTIRVWDTATGRLHANVERRYGLLTAMSLSPDNSLLMLSVYGGELQIWNLDHGALMETHRFTKEFSSLALSDCGNYLTTDRGVIEVGNNGPWRGFYVDGDWILRGQERVLWLPPDMRAERAILVNDLLILGCVSGRVELVQFCEQEDG